MPRKSRPHYRHAYYHVMVRGNNKQNIFMCEQDFNDYLLILEKASMTLGFDMHLFCLMNNHVHFVIEVRDIPISKVMQCINTKYANVHNRRHNKIGHVFQGRFKSKLVHDDQYLIELCYYIHMNPLKAGICKTLDEYPWSSHYSYSRIETLPWLKTHQVNSLLLALDSCQNDPYLNFMLKYKNQPLNTHFCSFDSDGDLAVKDSLHAKTHNQPSLVLQNLSLKEIINVICDYLHIDQMKLDSSRSHEITFAKSMIAYFAHYHAKYSLKDIANYFCMQADSLSRTLQRHLVQAAANKKISSTMNALENRFSLDRSVNT